jgi:hypothetical protein
MPDFLEDAERAHARYPHGLTVFVPFTVTRHFVPDYDDWHPVFLELRNMEFKLIISADYNTLNKLDTLAPFTIEHRTQPDALTSHLAMLRTQYTRTYTLAAACVILSTACLILTIIFT